MNYITYREAVKRTFSKASQHYNVSATLGQSLNELHCVIGMATEVDEYLDALKKLDPINAGEELGDMLWYLANLENLLGSQPACLQTRISVGDSLTLRVVAQHLLDLYKKKVFYNTDKYNTEITIWVSSMKATIIDECNETGLDIQSVMAHNINKLKVRYPEKFTTQAADNRDLSSERDALEGIDHGDVNEY